MATQDFLLEIGCAELPPTRLQGYSLALSDAIKTQLDLAELSYSSVHAFATPRRLSVLVNALETHQGASQIERQGPSVTAAYDKSGTPTLACLGFARSCNVSVDQLKIKETPKGRWIYCITERRGQQTAELLPELVNHSIKKLPIGKPMHWGNCETSFIRPVQWVVMMLGSKLIATTLLGQKTACETAGHRFHHPKKLLINQAKDYQTLLQTHGMVMADFNQRRDRIKKLIRQTAGNAGDAIIEDDLLNEVTAMVEWPVALLGQFKAEFLALPPEVLITSMKTHQRYFPICKDNKIQPYFILISNIESKNPQTVIEGNERVINARLADASFFYNNDLNTPLEGRLKKLDGLVFQHTLGSMAEKSKRIAKLAAYISKLLEAPVDLAKRAGLLSKCDLVSEMVYEFPSLQGTMGGYYAQNNKEPDDIATAIKEQYLPRYSGDALPQTTIACCVALADRLDTLIGILGINKIPSGDKDPFALRRAGLGILRILIEKNMNLDLLTLLKQAHKNYAVDLPNKAVVTQAFDFTMDRLRAWYLEKSIPPGVFAAVHACHPSAPLDFDQRIQAVQQFQLLPEAEALAAANKRVSNLLKKQEGTANTVKIDTALFESDAERRLAELLKTHAKTVESLYKDADYTRALSELSTLKESVDTFFDEVMVMVDDKKIRNNRLALLASLRQLFTQVADISLLS